MTNKIYAKGRAEIVYEDKEAIIMVDYAHSADAFEHLLKSIPNHFKNKIVLYGCGGDRDRGKRPLQRDERVTIVDLIAIQHLHNLIARELMHQNILVLTL